MLVVIIETCWCSFHFGAADGQQGWCRKFSCYCKFVIISLQKTESPCIAMAGGGSKPKKQKTIQSSESGEASSSGSSSSSGTESEEVYFLSLSNRAVAFLTQLLFVSVLPFFFFFFFFLSVGVTDAV